MGGHGSGWQGAKKATVEDALVLSISALMRKKALEAGNRISGSWHWTYQGQEWPHATIRYEADLWDQAAAWLRLHYTTANGEPMDYKVRLVTTRPHYGGLRWWFICPLVRRDGSPPRRCVKLCLPPGARHFGSYAGHGLTYASCQESGKFNALFGHIARDMGTDAASVRAALKLSRFR